MKKWYIYPLLIVLISLFSACEKNELDSTSIFGTSEMQQNEFDKWLIRNYVNPYNIDLKYRMEDIEADNSYNLIPADFDLSVKLAKIVKHAWLEAYDEAGGIDFTRRNVPKILHFIGSAAWDKGKFTLGTAEGGIKVTLFLGNWLDPTNTTQLNEYYFKVMHHEFAHILHQTKNYPQEYNLISAGHYAPSGWNNRDLETVAPLGFVTPYGGSEPGEDIAEITATYLTYTDDQWDEVWQYAGDNGRALIEQKIAIVKQYMKESWKIDMEQLRLIIKRRSNEVTELDLDHI